MSYTMPDRLASRLAFANIDKDTLSLLPEIWSCLQPAMPSVIDAFYSHAMSDSNITSLIWKKPSKLKTVQANPWERLFSGQLDEEYVAGIRRIGAEHHKIGMKWREYMAGYHFILSELSRHLITSNRNKTDRLAPQLVALNKAVLLDMSLALEAYLEDDFNGSVVSLEDGIDKSCLSMRDTAKSIVTLARELATARAPANAATTTTAENIFPFPQRRVRHQLGKN